MGCEMMRVVDDVAGVVMMLSMHLLLALNTVTSISQIAQRDDVIFAVSCCCCVLRMQ